MMEVVVSEEPVVVRQDSFNGDASIDPIKDDAITADSENGNKIHLETERTSNGTHPGAQTPLPQLTPSKRAPGMLNPISKLYEYAAKRKLAHPIFDIRMIPLGTGQRGSTKMEAKANAAEHLLKQLEEQQQQAGSTVDSTSSSVVPAALKASSLVSAPAKKSHLKRGHGDGKFFDIDEKNPIPCVTNILRLVGWPAMVTEEEAKNKVHGPFQTQCVAGPGQPDGTAQRKYISQGIGSSRKGAKHFAVLGLYNKLKECAEFQALWVECQARKGAKKTKRPVLESAKAHSNEALITLPTADSAHQSMAKKLAVILQEMRQCAAQTAAFLGPDSADGDAGAYPKQLMSPSAVLDAVAHKLSSIDMKVAYSITNAVDWSRDVDLKDSAAIPVEKTPPKTEAPVAVEQNGGTENTKGQEGMESGKGQSEVKVAAAEDVKPESGVKGKKSEDLLDASGSGWDKSDIYGSSETPLVDVLVEMSWREDGSNYPRTVGFKGSGASYGLAKDAGAVECFLHFGLRGAEFEIPRVG